MAAFARVVVTGIGQCSPLGTPIETLWSRLTRGESGIRRITKFDPAQLDTKIAGEIPDFSTDGIIDKRDDNKLDWPSRYALVATHFALQQSGLSVENTNSERIGCIVGCGVGDMAELEAQALRLHQKGPSRVSPYLIPRVMGNAASANVSIKWGFQGPTYSCSSACASAAHALGEAWRLIAAGECDACIAGGSEAAICMLAMAGFCSLKAMSTRNDEPTRASRPFDKDRAGFVMGEGGGILVLESEAHAKARGANILAVFDGFGMTADAYHITAPDTTGRGAARAMTQALQRAGWNADQVDYINAHGTSTPYNDKVESLAIKSALGEHARKVPVSSTKSMTGHLLGGSGGLEAVICVLCLQHGVIVPTVNYETPDSDCDLDYVPNVARQAPVRRVLSNSLGFGGHNVSLAFSKYA
ncbi:MAG: beta-ketoacyl-ACP synthase II [Planctomycetota bacterium]